MTSHPEPIAEVAVGQTGLPCPYPECVGLFHEAELTGELCVCGVCQRVAARCPRHGKHGRCRALNRPLARFCRHCRYELPDGWASAAWLRDLDAVPQESLNLKPPLDQPGDARWVLYLDDYLPPDTSDTAVSLLEAGGWLWLGAGGGRWLLVDPFSDINGARPLAFEQLWPGGARQLVRARHGGLWLVLYSQYGIKAVNLLALDDPRRDDYRPLFVWQPAAGEELLTDPVLLQVGRHCPERVAVWLAQSAAGLTLCASRLHPALDERCTVSRFTPDDGGRPLTAEDGRAVLRPVPLGERDGLLVATTQGVWLLTLPAELPDRPGPLAAVNLLRHRQLLVQVHEIPGVVLLPAEEVHPGSADDLCGTVYVAAAGVGGEELWAVPFNRRGPVTPCAYRDPGGIPLDVVAVRGRRQVLCWAGPSLWLCDALGQQHRVVTNDLLAWALQAQVFGRVAVCAGRGATQGGPRWFAELVDLEQDNGLLDVTVRDIPLAPPELLGRYVFTVEQVATQGRLRRWLTRRELRRAAIRRRQNHEEQNQKGKYKHTP